MNKTVLPMMHGFYSLGTLAGAGVGMALTAFGVPATVHILLAALVGIAPIYIAIQAIPDGTGKMLPMAPSMAKKAYLFIAISSCC
ncbi:DEOR-type transcriptional regulator [Escherichia coli]|nr:DEOR-type transcriptional regulator [Escherichia coli]